MKRLGSFCDWLFRKSADSRKSNTPVEFQARNIEQFGWRQGSLLPSDLVDRLVLQNLLTAPGVPGHWVVVTQDCDLIHHDLAAEPFAEIVFAEIVEKPDKGYTWGKNARELHLHDSDLQMSLAFQTRWRRSIPREYLSQFKPSPSTISKESTRLVTRWISRKYFRAAFPDAFNKRIGRKQEKIKNLLSKGPGEFQEIHIGVTDQELPEDQIYRIAIVCIATDAVSDDDKHYEQSLQLAEKFREIIDSCPGIKVVTCELRLKSEVTLEDLDLLQRWDFDSLTIRQTDTIDHAPKDP